MDEQRHDENYDEDEEAVVILAINNDPPPPQERFIDHEDEEEDDEQEMLEEEEEEEEEDEGDSSDDNEDNDDDGESLGPVPLPDEVTLEYTYPQDFQGRRGHAIVHGRQFSRYSWILRVPICPPLSSCIVSF